MIRCNLFSACVENGSSSNNQHLSNGCSGTNDLQRPHTQTTDDFNAKQYFQITNQVQVSRGAFDLSLPFDREINNVFGMRSGYTCCLANMHQGWTKFAQHLWFATPGKGLAALAYAPNQLKAKVGNDSTRITINEKTNYPFDDVIHFEVSTPKALAFPFQLRIPAWCKKATITVNGKKISTVKGRQLYTHQQTWKNGDKLKLNLPMEVTTSN